MRKVSRDHSRRKLPKLDRKLRDFLSRIDDADFLQMAWAVNLLQSKFRVDVSPYLNFPPEAATTDMTSPYLVYKWDIETLLIILFSTPKYVPQPGLNKIPNFRQFNAMGQAVNLLRSLENYEAGAIGDPSNVLMEMHRIGQRQFGWQRGFATTERLYRFAFVYGQGNCANCFRETYGLTIEQFLEVSFVLYAQLNRWPWAKPPDLKQFEIAPELLGKTLSLLARSAADIRTEVKALVDRASMGKAVRIAYLPSALRRFPIVTSLQRGTIISPLPELIMFRVTAGLYYDLCSGPQHLIAEANGRFEQYARKLIRGLCPRFDALPSTKYGTKKSPFETPDVLITDRGQIVAAIECKATKLTYEAQFAENPIDEAEKAYGQIIKGVTQLWRFFSHVRRGLYTAIDIADGAHAILLTMESWMQMSRELQTEATTRAKALLADDPDITEVDMRPVVFCSIQDISDIMFTTNEDDFLLTMEYAESDKYRGWGLLEIRREVGGPRERKQFPLKVEELLPWWGRFSAAGDSTGEL